jgi:hypothetical protein
MKRVKSLIVVGCLVAAATVNPVVAADGDIYSGVSSFSSDESTAASESPFLGVALPIPPDIVEGSVFTANCALDARKNHKGKGRPRVKGTMAPFAIKLDVGSGTWDFFGLSSSGIPFSTKKDGIATMTTGPVTAGAWANDTHPTNDFISLKLNFTNQKKIKETNLYCEIVIGDQQ